MEACAVALVFGAVPIPRAAADPSTKLGPWLGGKKLPDEAALTDIVEVDDRATDQVVSAYTDKRVPIDPSRALVLSIWVKTKTVGAHATVGLGFFDQAGTWLRAQNVDLDCVGDPSWQRWRAVIRQIPSPARFAEVRVAATEWHPEQQGVAWFAQPSLEVGDPWEVPHGFPIAAPSGIEAWVSPAEEQLRPRSRAPSGPSQPRRALVLHAMRGEYESFQVALRGRGSITALRPLVLTGTRGSSIPASLTVRRAGFVLVKKPSDATSRTGMLEDPLWPLEWPLELDDNVTPLFFSIHVPDELAPDVYRGSLALETKAGASLELPVELHVHRGALPKISSLKTSFNVPGYTVARFHGVEPSETSRYRALLARYYGELARARISATDPMQDAPMDITLPDWGWVGGSVVAGAGGSGRALEIKTGSIALRADSLMTTKPIAVRAHEGITVRWRARGSQGKRGRYRLRLTYYDASGAISDNAWSPRTAEGAWSEARFTVPPGRLPRNIDTVKVTFVADEGGATIDDVSMTTTARQEERLPNVGFEADPAKLPLQADFAAFDVSARRALDDWKMNGFRMWIDGFPFGLRGKRAQGHLFGFKEEDPEFKPLLGRVLKTMTDHLAYKGWLDRAYFYFYDEPQPVAEGSRIAAASYRLLAELEPRIARGLTGPLTPDTQPIVNLWMPLLQHLSTEEVRAAERSGKEVWTYVAGFLRPPVPNVLVDHVAMESRILPLAIKSMGLSGWTHWSVAQWNDDLTGPKWVDRVTNTMTTIFENGYVETGNADGWLFYPPTRNALPKSPIVADPVVSQRWEMIREGMEDVDRLAFLESLVREAKGKPASLVENARRLATIPRELVFGRSAWTDDRDALEAWRVRVFEAIDLLSPP